MKQTAKKILLYGATGSGKTHFITSLAKEMEVYGPILVIDTEQGSDTLGNYKEVTLKTLAEPSTELINVVDATLAKDQLFAYVEDIIDRLLTGQLPYKTVVLDSVTLLNEANIQATIKATPNRKRLAPNVPSQLDYRITQSGIQRILFKLGGIKTNLIVTAWEFEAVKYGENGEIVETKYSPNLTGKMRTATPHYFDIVARFASVTSTSWIGYFAGTANFTAKVRHNSETYGVKFPGSITDPTIQKVMHYFKEQTQ